MCSGERGEKGGLGDRWPKRSGGGSTFGKLVAALMAGKGEVCFWCVFAGVLRMSLSSVCVGCWMYNGSDPKLYNGYRPRKADKLGRSLDGG